MGLLKILKLSISCIWSVVITGIEMNRVLYTADTKRREQSTRDMIDSIGFFILMVLCPTNKFGVGNIFKYRCRGRELARILPQIAAGVFVVPFQSLPEG